MEGGDGFWRVKSTTVLYYIMEIFWFYLLDSEAENSKLGDPMCVPLFKISHRSDQS